MFTVNTFCLRNKFVSELFWSRSDQLITFPYADFSTKLGLMLVSFVRLQRFSIFFANFLGIFDGFSMFHRAFGMLHYETSSNMPKIWQKMKKNLAYSCLLLTQMALPKPEILVSCTRSVILLRLHVIVYPIVRFFIWFLHCGF